MNYQQTKYNKIPGDRLFFFKIIFFFILVFINFTEIISIDDLYKFKDQYLPENVEYEKNRKLCFFPFRNISSDEKLDYLKTGLPTVIMSGLNNFPFVFDEDVMPVVFYHEFGNPLNNAGKDSSKIINSKVLQELREGKRKSLPEKDPRYIKLQTELINSLENPPLIELAMELGKKYNCFYMITGEFSLIGTDRLKTQVELTFRKDRKNEIFQEETSLKRAFQEFVNIPGKIKKKLVNMEFVSVKFLTGSETNALIFIDGNFLGKSPLESAEIIPGPHRLYIYKEGFYPIEKNIEPKKGTKSIYDTPLIPINKKAYISVTSTPEGASVYWGSAYLGETPLVKIPVVSGMNRLKVTKEKFIDYSVGLELEDGVEKKINANLKEGDTETYYKNRLKVFLDYNYFDFSLYSFYSIIVFYSTYQYNSYMISRTRDTLRGSITYNGYTLYNALNNGTPFSDQGTLLYEQYLINKNEKKVSKFKDLRDLSKNAAIGMFLSSIIFYYLGIESDAVEFGFFKSKDFRNEVNSEGYIQFNIKF